MKNTTVTTIFGAILIAYVTHVRAADPWPMFQRGELVTLEGKDIPDEYRRKSITDTKGRVIVGEWLEIDRKAQTVKFRRTSDRKEFSIPIASLVEPDHRYAELETGYAWNTGEEPPVPIDLIPTADWKRNYQKPRIALLGAGILKTEVIDETIVRLTVGYPGDGDPFSNGPRIEELPLNMLSDNDRATIKAATGDVVPILPRPGWSSENSEYWERKVFRYGRPMSKFDPAESRIDERGMLSKPPTMFNLAWENMSLAFSHEEIFDHLRVKTLTSAFLFEQAQYRWEQRQKAMSGKPQNQQASVAVIEPLGEIMRILSQAEPETERVSLKDTIAKFGIRPFEETVPNEAANNKANALNEKRRDGRLQAIQFIANYKHMAEGKPKVSLAAVLANTEDRHISGSSRYLSYDKDKIDIGITKSHGVQIWDSEKIAEHMGDKVLELDAHVSHRLFRYKLRNNQPVMVVLDEPGSEVHAILTGFTRTPGKAPTYDAIVISGHFDSGGRMEPYNVSEQTGIPASKIRTLYYGILK